MRTEPQKFIMYYWVGQMAPLDDKKLAARFALLQYILYQEYLDGLREVFNLITTREGEHIESESFLNTINFIDRMGTIEKLRNKYAYADMYLDSRCPSLYIVKGTNIVAWIKEVPISTQWLKNDICLILEDGYKVEEQCSVMTYCGPNTGTIVREKSIAYGRGCAESYNCMDLNFHELMCRYDLIFKKFIEILEDRNNFNPYEVDDSQDELKNADVFVTDRDKNVSLYRISDNGMELMTQEESDAVTISEFSNKSYGNYGCHLLDTASVAGLIFFMHHNDAQKAKLKAIEMVEDYIHYNYTLASKPIRTRVKEFPQSARFNSRT